MYSNKDYSKMTLEELASAQEKIKSQKTMIAALIGLMIGFAIYSATHKGSFIITIILLVVPFLIGQRHTQSLKNIQEEISRRS